MFALGAPRARAAPPGERGRPRGRGRRRRRQQCGRRKPARTNRRRLCRAPLAQRPAAAHRSRGGGAAGGRGGGGGGRVCGRNRECPPEPARERGEPGALPLRAAVRPPTASGAFVRRALCGVASQGVCDLANLASQAALQSFGLSSLGSMEASVMPHLDNVLRAARALAAPHRPLCAEPPSERAGHARLNAHAGAILGERHHTRIMARGGDGFPHKKVCTSDQNIEPGDAAIRGGDRPGRHARPAARRDGRRAHQLRPRRAARMGRKCVHPLFITSRGLLSAPF